MKWVYGILLLGFIVFFHELGHFLAARIFGVTVESFSLGFGPVLFHKKHGDTDYRISAFPLGGYCGMKGEKDFAAAVDAGLDHIEAERDSLYGIHPFKRALIGFAGPFNNLLFSFIALTVISMTGYTYYSYPAKITLADEVYPELHSAARDAGLKDGDVITAINGTAITDFSGIIEAVAPRPDENITVSVDRNGERLSFTVHTDFDKTEGSGKIGIVSAHDSLITCEAPHYSFFPALANGFKETFKTVGLTLKGIAILFKGVDVKKAVSGPARITDMLGDTVQQGFAAGFRNGMAGMLDLMAFISISLFVMNLLPVPVLDGGLILFAFIQIIIRRQVHPKVQYYVQFIGLAFIAVLFAIGLTGDISYFSGVFSGAQK